MSISLCGFCGKWIRVYFSSLFEQSVVSSVVVKVNLVGEMCGEKDYVGFQTELSWGFYIINNF